jgi:hypothetical protein
VKVILGDRAFWHIDVVPLISAIGNGLTVTVALPAWVCRQLVLLASRTLTNEYVYVPDVPVGTDTDTLFPDVVVTVWFVPLFMLYVNVYGAVPFAPVKVIFGEAASLHTDTVPLIVAVGSGLIVTTALPL